MRILVLTLCSLLVATPAISGKPEWAGNGKNKDKAEKVERTEKAKGYADRDRSREVRQRYFSEREEGIIRDFYARDRHAYGDGRGPKPKNLPPGLRKKLERGGDLPPGWQRKLERGEVVDREVRAQAHSVPDALVDRLPIDPRVEEVIRVQDKVIRMSKGEGTIIDVIDIADVLSGRGMRTE